MSLNELQVIAGFFERAMCPEDVFGHLGGKTKKEKDDALRHSYRNLVKALHPDRHNGDVKAAELSKQLFQELEKLHAEAERRLTRGSYGSREPLPEKIPVIINGKYVCEKAFIPGDVADLYFASLESSKSRGNLLVKAARSSSDNDLLVAEQIMLELLHRKLPKDTWGQCVPTILDSFLLNDGKFQKRRVNVMDRFDGFLTAEEIRRRMPNGIDARTFAWMWKRLLVLLDWTYHTGIVHGAILPPHVMFYPDNDGGKQRDIRKHSIRLVDWCYAVDYKNRTRLSAWLPQWKDYYAPEVLAKEPLGPWTDLYMGAATMVYMLGDFKKNGLLTFDFAGLPGSMAGSLAQCLEHDPKKRPQSLSEYFIDFTELLKKEYGAPKWYDFVVPGV